MIENLRKKFILVAMASTFAVLVIIMGMLHFLNYRRLVDRADEVIEYLAENHGDFGEHFLEDTVFQDPEETESEESVSETDSSNRTGKKNRNSNRKKKADKGRFRRRDFDAEMPFSTRFFTVTFDSEGEIRKINVRKIAAVTEIEAEELVTEVMHRGRDKGFVDVYRYGKVDTDNGFMILFVDRRQELTGYRNLLWFSTLTSLLGLLLVFILVLIFSKIVFRPVEESYRRQKQFITDASHELKTPLAIIDANTEVLEMTEGENQWTESTRKQVKRLNELTQSLVTLTRLDEKGTEIETQRFCLSETLEDLVWEFEPLAESKEKQLKSDVYRDLYLQGDEQKIRQLIGILLDNAIKYSLPQSEISVSLWKKGRKLFLSVENDCEEMPQENMDVLFERFYRLDQSRNSQSGGSGIGLSIAKAIVEAHRGRIHAVSRGLHHLQITAEFREG